MLLRFEDRNSMAHGVEARVPFVDGPLMHFALSLPPEYLLQGDLTKPLLRESVGDFMPTLVLNRRDKIGFQTAERLWFKKDKLRIEVMINEAVERLPTLFGATTKQKVMRVLDGYESFNNIPWRVLSTFFWANAHMVEE
jgi:asparagine synthase (glutamine-hydrolysing)